MKSYQKILRRLNSHPRFALELIRRTNRHAACKCKKCGCSGHLEIHHTDSRGVKTFLCKSCNKTYSELYGTICYRSKIPPSLWLITLIEWSISTGSVSAAEIKRRHGINYDSAWKMLMKIRSMMINVAPQDMLSGIVEIDEAWFGKKDNQQIMFGLVDRINHKLRLVLLPHDPNEAIIHEKVHQHVRRRSTVMTDGASYYGFISALFDKYSVNHSKSEFARRQYGLKIHTNTMEQIWGDIKGIIRTIHHGVSKAYRLLYLAEYAFRYNFKRSHDLFFFTLHHACQLNSPMLSGY